MKNNIPSPVGLNRRQFMQAGLILGASSVAGVRLLWPVSNPLTHTSGVLNLTEANILSQIYMAMTGGSEKQAEKALKISQRFFRSLAFRERFELRMAVRIFDQGGGVTFRRFTSMTSEEKQKALEKWEKVSGLRGILFGALREISYLAHYSMDENWEQIGYSGPVVEKGDNDPDFNSIYEGLLKK